MKTVNQKGCHSQLIAKRNGAAPREHSRRKQLGTPSPFREFSVGISTHEKLVQSFDLERVMAAAPALHRLHAVFLKLRMCSCRSYTRTTRSLTRCMPLLLVQRSSFMTRPCLHDATWWINGQGSSCFQPKSSIAMGGLRCCIKPMAARTGRGRGRCRSPAARTVLMQRSCTAVLLSTRCDFALGVVSSRQRSIRSNLEYVILAGSSVSP